MYVQKMYVVHVQNDFGRIHMPPEVDSKYFSQSAEYWMVQTFSQPDGFEVKLNISEDECC
jgi:hypothetical protein